MVRLNRRKLNVDPIFFDAFRELKSTEARRLGLSASELSDRKFSKMFARRMKSSSGVKIFFKEKRGSPL